MKTMLTLLALATLSAQASELTVNNQPLTCRVDKIEGGSGHFFGRRFPALPLVGDELSVDLSKDTVTNLMGAQGRGIPLAYVGATLKRTSPGATHVFHGTHEGELGTVYALTLTASEGPTGAIGHISLTKNAKLVSIDLICKK